MLQKNKAHAFINDDGPTIVEESGGLGELVDFAIGLLRRQYRIILFCMVLGLGAGFVYLRITPPVYTARAALIIDPQKSPFIQQQGLLGEDPIEVDSQMEILKSKAVASSVIRDLKLMEDPEFRGSGGGLITGLLGFFSKADATNKSQSEADIMEAMATAFSSGLAVSRVSGRVIEISYSSRDPSKAAQITNAIANAYITDQLEAKYEANRIASNWLQERLNQLRQKADTAQRAVESFKAQNNIVSIDGKNLDQQQLAELNGRLSAARVQSSDLSARLNRLQAIIRAGPSDSSLDGAITELGADPVVTSLRQQYLELARREAEWSARYGRDHLAVVNLRNRMREIRESMFAELRRNADTAKNDYEIAKQRQEQIERQLADGIAQSRTKNQAEVTLRELDATATGYRSLHDTFLQRYMGTAQQESFPITEARVISPASPPLSKSKPKGMVVLFLSLIGGSGLGVGIGLLRQIMDRVIRTEEQLEAALRTPCLALVPRLKPVQARQSPRKNKLLGYWAVGQRGAPSDAIFRTVVESPLSSFTEAIRSIKLAVDLNLGSKPGKVIGFTSSLPNEGKSTLAAAFAALTMQVNGRVILVDCDLRNPSLSRMLAPTASTGIVDVISGGSSRKEAVRRDAETNISFLPMVKKTPLIHTTEIFASESMRKLFDELRAEYDYVVVDLPPLAPVIDVRATANIIDSYMLVVEWGRTSTDVVEQCLKSSPMVYDALIGAILNKTDMDAMKLYDSHTFYNNRYYARYGYTE
jgi:polysaccharide biosynthesis transport protein